MAVAIVNDQSGSYIVQAKNEGSFGSMRMSADNLGRRLPGHSREEDNIAAVAQFQALRESSIIFTTKIYTNVWKTGEWHSRKAT